MFKFSGLVAIKFAEPIDLYIRKVKDTIEIVQVSASDASTEVLTQSPELELLPDYVRCSVIHGFGCTAKQLKSVPIEIAETLVLVDGDICDLATFPDVYAVDSEGNQ